MSAADEVNELLEDGWRPSLETREWVRGGVVVVVRGENRFEDESDAPRRDMTVEQEQVLIERVWSESPAPVSDVQVVQGAQSGRGDDDGVS